MSSESPMRHSFYNEDEITSPNDFIYDQLYKNAATKNKYLNNPKYTYYNALLSMKQKLSQERTSVFDCLFQQPQKRHFTPSPVSDSPSTSRKNGMPVYHVEKINKMKFKIYKQGGAQYLDRLPITDLSFQIKVNGNPEKHNTQNAKPRLEEILSEYKKMSISQGKPKSRGPQRGRSMLGSDPNVKMMRKTVYKMGGLYKR